MEKELNGTVLGKMIRIGRLNPYLVINVALLFILPSILVFYGATKPCLVYECRIDYVGVSIPTRCEWLEENAPRVKNLFGGSGVPVYNLSKLQSNPTTTEPEIQTYLCPDCPVCAECPDPPPQTCGTSSISPGTTTTTTTTTGGPTPTIPLPVYSEGGDVYGPRPTKVDLKWRMCNPFENVSVPVEYIVRLSNQTYNKTWINGTTEVINRSSEIEYKTIKGGCIIVSANCCRCEIGGSATPINAKYYQKYYSDVLTNCSGKRTVCPMIMRSPVGCSPSTQCINGLCSISGR